MAKPDLDDGWLKYAHELDAALAAADFTKVARIVLREVFGQVFGPAKLKGAKLSPTDIGARVGLPRQAVHRGIAELVDSGALSRRGDGSYAFLKDYQLWTRKGSPRLTPAESEWCRNAGRSALSYKQESVINPDDKTPLPVSSIEMTPSSIEMTGPSSIEMTVCHQSRLQTVSAIDDKNVPPLRTPLVGPVRNENREPAPAPGVPTIDDCLEEAAKTLGPHAASLIVHDPADLLRAVSGRTDCLLAAIRELAREPSVAQKPRGWVISKARSYRGDPPPPPPRPPTMAEKIARNRLIQAERDREREAKEAARKLAREVAK